jgi:MscS family membrane protein
MKNWKFLTDKKIAGNTIWQYASLFFIILGLLILWQISLFFLRRIANKFEEKGRKFMSITIHAIMKSLLLFYLVIGFKIGTVLLTLADPVTLFFQTVISILFIVAIARLAYSMVDVVDTRMRDMAVSSESTVSEMLSALIGRTFKIIIAVIALLQVVTLLIDKPLTSVLAGLGIGGLAFALAAQDTLKNFFGSLAIFTDKPFLIGERVVVDGHDGPVEDVGLRSTRIRTLDGHLVTIPNGELASKTIQNIGRRPYIRRLFNIGVTYDTPPEKIEKALEIIKDILKDHEGMNPEFPPRVYFNEFNSDSLNILVIYWYHPPNYWDFLQFGERVNSEILRRFNSEGIDFAFPTQTLHLAGDNKRPLNIGISGEVPEGSRSYKP